MNRKDFIKILVEKFPEIKDDVLDEDSDGLITLQMGYFRKLIQRAIDENNLSTIKTAFQFIDDVIGKVDDRLENAIYLSFLGKLDFDKNPNAKKSLSKKMQNAEKDLHNHSRSDGTNGKLKKFLNDL